MKKLLFFLTLSLFFLLMKCVSSYAYCVQDNPDKKEDVDMREKSNPVRSLLLLPEVCHYESGSIITITLNDANAMYDVLIYDSEGLCVMSDIFIANGITQTYRIASLGSGLHTIVIVNNYREFEGAFVHFN